VEQGNLKFCVAFYALSKSSSTGHCKLDVKLALRLFFFLFKNNSFVRLPCWRPMLVLVCLSGLEGPNEYSIMFSLLVYTVILNLANHRISVHVRVGLLVNYQRYIL
jgi:hypothetical protein